MKNTSALYKNGHPYEFDKGNTIKNTLGFAPAFYDFHSDTVFLSRYANESPAPVHIIGGLPRDSQTARKKRIDNDIYKNTIILGFVRGKHFYTREQAVRGKWNLKKLTKSSPGIIMSNCK